MLAPGERFILVATSYCLTLQTRQLCDAVPSTLQTLPASTHVPDAVFFFSLDVRQNHILGASQSVSDKDIEANDF
ncbi:hypothetical protein V8E53_011506 [Lactarius tabidus]